MAPDPTVHEAWRDRRPAPSLFADYARDIVRRLLADREVSLALFHYALEGLVLDRLTVSIDPEISTDAAVEAFVRGILGDDPPAGQRPVPA